MSSECIGIPPSAVPWRSRKSSLPIVEERIHGMADASPLHWSEWSAEEWNRQLILFCFVRDADATPDQGLRASEDDLPDITHDPDGASAEMAKALAWAIRRQARDGELSPARLLYEHVNRYRPTSQGVPPLADRHKSETPCSRTGLSPLGGQGAVRAWGSYTKPIPRGFPRPAAC
jgi:hypothetical protein